MITVQKNNKTRTLKDDTQLAAFLKAGWEQADGTMSKVQESKEPAEDIEVLKAEADALGVKYNPNIGAAKLKERIEEHKANA